MWCVSIHDVLTGPASSQNEEQTGESSTTAAGEVAGAVATAAATTDEEQTGLKELPFQVQIQYTDIDGATALRVLTKTQRVTKKREIAEDCTQFS